MKSETKQRIAGGDYPRRGSRWRPKIQYGDDDNRVCRVLSVAPVDGYIVWRFKGAAPHLTHLSDWDRYFEALS